MGPTLLLVLGLLVASCMGDVYMHNPRGSNNRLNERSANRDNANRMFDSQVRAYRNCRYGARYSLVCNQLANLHSLAASLLT